jgi:hypothetical protein
MARMAKRPTATQLRARSDAGDLDATVALADALACGDLGLERDKEAAQSLLEHAAKAGHPLARFRVAQARFKAEPRRALAAYIRCAAQGCEAARHEAARVLVDGFRVPADPARALKLLRGAKDAADRELVRRARLHVAVERMTESTRLRRSIEGFGVQSREPALRAALWPSVRLVTRPVAMATLPLGKTRLGGTPDLPAHVEWPTLAGKPMQFLAQVRLRDVARHDSTGLLPRRGSLWVFFGGMDAYFADPKAPGLARVLFEPEEATLERRSPPAGVTPLTPCSVRAFPEATLPFFRTERARALFAADAKLAKRYFEVRALHATDLRRAPRNDGDVHRMLGHEDAIQGDMTRRMEYDAAGADLDTVRPDLEARAAGWRLLLQVDSDRRLGVMWGDLGRLYFWIREEDLRAARFDDVRVQMQC